MKQFAVIGLGRFGQSVALSLASDGQQVLAVDKLESEVDRIADYVTEAMRADAMDEDFLQDIDIASYDAVIVAMGQNSEASIMVCMLLKDLGVENIIAKAHSKLHGEVLERIGVNRIIYPEWDMGERVAKMLTTSHRMLDYIELSPEHSIIEFEAPPNFSGKSLKDLALRTRRGISVMAIKKGEKVVVGPGGDTEVEEGDVLVAIGHQDCVREITESLQRRR
jgi:trk system potassium uptake protein TrkA